MKEYYMPEWMSYRHPRKPRAHPFDFVTCPACGHFAAFRVNSEGKVDVSFDPAVSYQCAIWKCSHKFTLEEAVPSERPVCESEFTGPPLIMDRLGVREWQKNHLAASEE